MVILPQDAAASDKTEKPWGDMMHGIPTACVLSMLISNCMYEDNRMTYPMSNVTTTSVVVHGYRQYPYMAGIV